MKKMTQLIIEELLVLDRQSAITDLGTSELYENMLVEFDETSLPRDLVLIKVAFDEFDYYNVRAHCNSLRGSAGYIRAERVSAAAHLVTLDIESQMLDDLIKHYACLIKQCILLKQAIRKEVSPSKRNDLQ